MTTNYLYDWDVGTLLPLQDKRLKKLAIRLWAETLIEKSGMKTSDFIAAHFYDPTSGGKRESFYRWYREGYPDPKVLLKDGLESAPLKLNKIYPNTFQILVHPGWVILSGPKSLDTCKQLIDRLDKNLVSVLSRRYRQSPPGFPNKRSLFGFLLGDFDCDSYVTWLADQGSIESFIAAVGLSIEAFLNNKNNFKKSSLFQFEPMQWQFFGSLSDFDKSTLENRLKDLDKLYLNVDFDSLEYHASKILQLHLKNKTELDLSVKQLEIEKSLNQ